MYACTHIWIYVFARIYKTFLREDIQKQEILMPLRKEPAAGDSSEERFFLASLCITSCFNHEHETFSEKVAVPGTSCRKASYTDKKKDSRPIALFFFNFIYSKISKISLFEQVINIKWVNDLPIKKLKNIYIYKCQN